jgi:hypothetical protein
MGEGGICRNRVGSGLTSWSRPCSREVLVISDVKQTPFFLIANSTLSSALRNKYAAG